MDQCSICLEDVVNLGDFDDEEEARPAHAPPPPKTRKRPAKKKHGFVGKRVEGAEQKANGKWVNHQILPGHEFDSLNEYRAAKKQRAARRAAWSAQAY